MEKNGKYITLLLRVRGLVQGVGFRYWTRSKAVQLGLGGYVRNLPDRSVEAFFTGPEDVVERMQELMASGPGHSFVDELEVVERKETDAPVGGFRIIK